MLPSSVSDRTVSTISTTSITGMIALLAFSIPDRTPLITTTAIAVITMPVHASCRSNDPSTNP